MHLRTLITPVVAALGLAAFPAAAAVIGSGNAVTQKRDVSGFQGLRLSVPARVEVVQGTTEGVTLTADDNIAAEIETVVEDSSLRIRWRTRNFDARLKTPIRVTVNARVMDAISISGSGDVSAHTLTAKQLALHISGSGDVSIGGGRAESLSIHISGSGDVKASKLDSDSVSVRIAGSGDASVWARKALSVHVAGSGDVRYYGDPAVSQRIAGSGAVRRAGASPG